MAHEKAYTTEVECTGPVRLHVEVALGKAPGATQGLKPTTSPSVNSYKPKLTLKSKTGKGGKY